METDASNTTQIVLIGAMAGNAILLAGAAVWFCLRTWGVQRRLEREEFHRGELYKQMLERGELTMDKLQDVRRQAEEAAQQPERQVAGHSAFFLTMSRRTPRKPWPM